jgi:predicted permease
MGWFRHLFTRRRIFDDLHEEIEQHLAERVESLMAGGMCRRDAEYAARRAFGNVTRMEESGREAWLWPRTERLLSDIRFALRKLRHSPGFALTAILTLAFGIGANVVVFSILNGLLLRPLDIPHPENFVQVTRGNGDDSHSYPDFRDFRDRDSSFSGLVATSVIRAGMTIGNSTEKSWGNSVSANYFDVLGLEPALGRFFHQQDDRGLGSAPFIVLSNDFWRRQFNSNAQVVGQTVRLNQHAFTVIGVAPRDFSGLDPFFWPDFFIPIVNAEQVTGWSDLCCRDHMGVWVMGRLKPGVSRQQAIGSLNALAKQMAKEDVKDDGLTLGLREPGPASVPGADPIKKILLGIMLLAALVLLAACANLAGIFAARTSDRGAELAMRMAVGATHAAVLRELLTEAVLVSLLGGVVGSGLARLLLFWLARWQAFGDFPTHFLIEPDARVYLLAIGLSIASGILFGLLPARQIWRTDVVQTIKSGHVPSEHFRRFALRDILLVVQIVVCTLLVTASLVAVRGMMRALELPLGFNPEGVTMAQADLRMAGYTGDTAFPVQKRLLDAARAIPGVTSATVADAAPFFSSGQWFVYKWDTTVFQPSHMAFAAPTYLITPGYWKTAQTALVSGRDFTWDDKDGSPRVAIVNQTFARRLFGDAPPLGQRFALWATAKYEVVGVVEDGKYMTVGEDAQPAMFFPLAQGVGEVKSSSALLLVRSTLPRGQIAAALYRALSSAERGAPFIVSSWDDAVDRTMMPARAGTVMVGVMGMLAAMLAVTGIFGMASYTVSRRMREQGIRVALGAQRIQVVRAILRRPVILLLIGSALGIAAGLATSRVLSHLVSLATPHDPLVLAGVLLTMTLLGVLATWIPARRALKIDPAQLLRE